mmetsp:Transcript_16556/g.42710  ORF Transcript_16556/g.42710 Transcript_16556/m.42710 type:complete len:458 (+) Transcript_16556:62-1435(+)
MAGRIAIDVVRACVGACATGVRSVAHVWEPTAVDEEVSSGGLLAAPLLQRHTPVKSFRASCSWVRAALGGTCSFTRRAFFATTDAAFIRSEVNGRQSRRVVLFAFFCTDAIGAFLWACWCENYWDLGVSSGTVVSAQTRACGSFGVNHFVVLFVGMPIEGIVLFSAGRNPWSFWSDGLLLPVWLIRLGLFDVLLWNVSPQMLMGDALWFSVMAVMCRVHSLALLILVGSQIASLCVVLCWHQEAKNNVHGFDFVHYGIYSVTMLIIMAGAYILDEQSRLQSFEQFMSLQDQNAVLAESLLRWKVIPSEPPGQAEVATRNLGDSSSGPFTKIPVSVGFPLQSTGWQHTVLEDLDDFSAPSRSSSGPCAPQYPDMNNALPLPSPSTYHASSIWEPRLCREGGVGTTPVSRGVRFFLPQTTRDGRPLAPTHRPKAAQKRSPTVTTSSSIATPLDLMEVIE